MLVGSVSLARCVLTLKVIAQRVSATSREGCGSGCKTTGTTAIKAPLRGERGVRRQTVLLKYEELKYTEAEAGITPLRKCEGRAEASRALTSKAQG
jgi:hypothetical protein